MQECLLTLFCIFAVLYFETSGRILHSKVPRITSACREKFLFFLKRKKKRTDFLVTEIHTVPVWSFLICDMSCIENFWKHVCFPPFPHAVLRINSCVGESNHQAFILALSIFLLTSVYGITLTLDTICRDRSVFTALFYCPGVYANYRWDVAITERPTEEGWLLSLVWKSMIYGWEEFST